MDQYAKREFQASYGVVQRAPKNYRTERTPAPTPVHGVRIGAILKSALKDCPKK